VKKPDELRRVLLAHVPELGRDADKLSIFIDRGGIAARAGSLGFEYRYTLNVVVQDYAGEVDALMVPVLAWIAEAQPDLLERAVAGGTEPFRFESEILDGDAADVSIYIELTEGVIVKPKEGGGFTAERVDDRPPADEFPDVCCVPLWQLFLRDQLVAQSSDPDFEPAPAP
jgi:hypothetical protein